MKNENVLFEAIKLNFKGAYPSVNLDLKSEVDLVLFISYATGFICALDDIIFLDTKTKQGGFNFQKMSTYVASISECMRTLGKLNDEVGM